MSAQTARLPGLDGIRAVAALCILLSHIPQRDFCSWSVPSLPVPDLCAYTFFVLSGFLSGYKIHSITSLKQYLIKKVKRLLPPYFLCISFVVLFYALSNSPDVVINRKLFYYLFLIPQVPFSKIDGILPLVHLWFIGVLLFFHLLFPLVCKGRGIDHSIAIIVIWLSFKYGVYFLIGSNCFIYRLVSCTALDCLFGGACIGQLYFNGSHIIRLICDSKVFQLLSWGLFFSFSFYDQLIPAPIRVQCFAALSIMLVLSQLGKNVIINLDNRHLSFFGSISYELYLFQIPVIIGLSSMFVRMNISKSYVLVYVSCTAISFVIAFLVNSLLNPKYGICNRVRPRW